ncbi:pseudouridine synthase [Vogesella mureinivorans]|uniref:pseudouridine synthase n=1 Tax=Vogesella mureinivorans TaxID=657276 RepID=UPI0011CC1FCF|nr:pseudouridine synthase [Vogesella mureinivorans]
MSAVHTLDDYTPPPDTGLQLYYQDDYLLVVDKPAGLLSVPGRGDARQDCLSLRVQQRFPDALVVHRLDMATSGLLLMARGLAMQRQLSAGFAGRDVQKTYQALVAGQLQPALGDIHLPLMADWLQRPRQKVDLQDGKPSHTGYQLLAYDAAADVSRVSLTPHTGRTHQLRVHMQALGHPMLGDTLYAPLAVQQAAPRLCLHACALQLRHPHSGTLLQLHSPVPF